MKAIILPILYKGLFLLKGDCYLIIEPSHLNKSIETYTLVHRTQFHKIKDLVMYRKYINLKIKGNVSVEYKNITLKNEIKTKKCLQVSFQS